MSKATLTRRTSDAFEVAPSRHPLVAGHMYKENKTRTMFDKRYFALYSGGLLAYYKHERNFKKDVKRHEGVPLHCKLVNLNGVYLSWPESHIHGAKYCFRLHAPETSNHRQEFLLACHNKKEMKIWIEQLQSQNPDLQPPMKGEKLHKVPSYIMKMRVRSGSCSDPMSKLDSEWLKQAHSSPGAVALFFSIGAE